MATEVSNLFRTSVAKKGVRGIRLRRAPDLKSFLVLFIFILPACLSFPENSKNTDISPTPPLNFNYDTKMKLALGGVVPGWDQLLIENLGPTDEVKLNFDPPDIAGGTEIDATASSVTFQIIPQKAGITQITYLTNGVRQEKVIKLVIPPQEMIQILLGEARSIIPQEVIVDSEERVERTSSSPTAQALFSVIRNRIKIIEEQDAPYLFVIERDEFKEADLAERYPLVITAHSNSVYQFSPVDPGDPSFPAYDAGAIRAGLSGNRLLTYDQGVLTAADFFDEELTDNTQGAFGFYSPTKDQYENLITGLGSTLLPEDIGTSDSQFPALAPIQIRILNEISPQTFDAELPSFVFVGLRNSTDEAVIRF